MGCGNNVHSALTFKDFVPRLELLTLSGHQDFLGLLGKICKFLTILVDFANHIWFYF